MVSRIIARRAAGGVRPAPGRQDILQVDDADNVIGIAFVDRQFGHRLLGEVWITASSGASAGRATISVRGTITWRTSVSPKSSTAWTISSSSSCTTPLSGAGRDQHLEFFDRVRSSCSEAERAPRLRAQLQAGEVEQPRDGSQHGGGGQDRARHEAGDTLGILEGRRLGGDLPEDDEQKGGQGEGQRGRNAGGHPGLPADREQAEHGFEEAGDHRFGRASQGRARRVVIPSCVVAINRPVSREGALDPRGAAIALGDQLSTRVRRMRTMANSAATKNPLSRMSNTMARRPRTSCSRSAGMMHRAEA